MCGLTFPRVCCRQNPFEAGHDLDRMQREIMDKDREIEQLQWKLIEKYEDWLGQGGEQVNGDRQPARRQ